jgi:PAS domain S-box-containing protein
MDVETSKRVYQTFNEVYKTGVPAKAFDWELIRKDGTKRILETSVSLMRDSKGRPIGFYGIGRDITERKQAETALRESEEKYRTILHSIEEFYYEVDLSGNLTFFNDAMAGFSGYSKEELMGMNNRTYMSEETAKKVYQTFNEVYRTGIPTRGFDWELIRKDGSKRFFETSVSLMHDSKGQPVGFYGIGRDITERKQAEEQARIHQQQMMQVSKMVALGTLVSSMAHEINNPNNFIMLNTPLLSEAWKSAMPILDEYYARNGDFVIGGMKYTEIRENVPALFSGIWDGSRRIKQIVEDLRNFVRKDTADMSQSVDVNAVLKSAVALLSNMIMKSTNHFSIEYEENLPVLRGNFQRFEQVMINLIQNACQALSDTRKGIFASTSYDEKRRSIVVKVEDQGVGIRPEILSHITDPFYTTKSDSGCLGLGLSISSRIVKEHGGTLTFTSELGKGTKAEIVLPVFQDNPATMEMEE